MNGIIDLDLYPFRDASGDPVQVDWIGSSWKDLLGFPEPVIREIGHALSVAQYGEKHPSAKPLKGIGPAVLEIVENHQGNAYRAIYTPRFKDRIYVLHCFQKKSRRGSKTSLQDIGVIKERLRQARTDYEQRQRKRRK